MAAVLNVDRLSAVSQGSDLPAGSVAERGVVHCLFTFGLDMAPLRRSRTGLPSTRSIAS